MQRASGSPDSVGQRDEGDEAVGHWTAQGYVVSGRSRSRHGEHIRLRVSRMGTLCRHCGAADVFRCDAWDFEARDIPRGGAPVTVAIRMEDRNCRICARRSRDDLPGIDVHRRISDRLAMWIAAQQERSVKEIAAEAGVGYDLIRAIRRAAAISAPNAAMGPPPGYITDDVAIERHVSHARGYDLFVAPADSAVPVACPHCGSAHVALRRHARIVIYDLPHEGRPVKLVFERHRTFRCTDCRWVFWETLPGAAFPKPRPRYRLTHRLAAWVAAQAGLQPDVAVAMHTGISLATVRAIFRAPMRHAAAAELSRFPAWFALPGLVVTNFSEDTRQYHFHVNARPALDLCPNCGSEHISLRWRPPRAVRDVPRDGKNVVLYLSTIVCACADCQARTEQVQPDIDMARKMTAGLKDWIVAQGWADPSAIARRLEVPRNSVMTVLSQTRISAAGAVSGNAADRPPTLA